MKLKEEQHTTQKPVNINAIYKALKKEFNNHQVPVVDLIQIQTKDPFKVLITTILSARTKDNTTTAAASCLFSVVNSMEGLKNIGIKKLEKLIYPVGFYSNKAKHLKELPGVLDTLYGGVIPQTVEELVKLPGVGRLTS
jgi:endonuclease III